MWNVGCGMWDVTQNCPVLPPKFAFFGQNWRDGEKLLLSLFTSPSAYFFWRGDDVMCRARASWKKCVVLDCTADKINRSREGRWSGRWSRRSIDK